MRSLAAFATALALALPVSACSSSTMEFQEPAAGPAVVGEQTFQVRTEEATKGGGKAGKARRADNGGSMSKGSASSGVLRRGPNNGGSMSKSGGSAGAEGGSAGYGSSARMTGTVVAWDQARGIGFISPDDGSGDLFFHKGAILAGSNMLAPGASVTFVKVTGPKGVQAGEVTSGF